MPDKCPISLNLLHHIFSFKCLRAKDFRALLDSTYNLQWIPNNVLALYAFIFYFFEMESCYVVTRVYDFELTV